MQAMGPRMGGSGWAKAMPGLSVPMRSPYLDSKRSKRNVQKFYQVLSVGKLGNEVVHEACFILVLSSSIKSYPKNMMNSPRFIILRTFQTCLAECAAGRGHHSATGAGHQVQAAGNQGPSLWGRESGRWLTGGGHGNWWMDRGQWKWIYILVMSHNVWYELYSTITILVIVYCINVTTHYVDGQQICSMEFWGEHQLFHYEYALLIYKTSRGLFTYLES